MPNVVSVVGQDPRKFAGLRPMQRWVPVSFSLSRRVHHRTITRKVVEQGGRFWHVANIARPDDLDDAVLGLLTEAFEEAARY
jgi:hypothetical protein